jgi:hypothetical protein
MKGEFMSNTHSVANLISYVPFYYNSTSIDEMLDLYLSKVSKKISSSKAEIIQKLDSIEKVIEEKHIKDVVNGDIEEIRNILATL